MVEKNNNSPWPAEIEVQGGETKIPWLKILTIFIFLLAIGALAVGYFFYRPQEPEIKIEIQKPEKILAGESFNLKVTIYNNSDQTINETKIFLSLPDGISFLEDDPNKKNVSFEVGSIGPKSIYNQTFKLIAFSNELSTKKIELKLNYKTLNSSIFFENKSYIDLNVEKSAIDIFVFVPEKVYSFEKFKMNIVYENNSEYDFNNVSLILDYPPAFKLIDTNPAIKNNEWQMGILKAKTRGSIEVLGEIVGDFDQSYNFVIKILTKIGNKSFVLASQNYNLTVFEAPLAVNILLNNESEYVAEIGEKLNYVFQYRNNSSIPMENVVLIVKLNSGLFDFDSVETNAYFDSLNNVFIWNSANYSQFRSLPPNSFGEVGLKIKLKDNFPILSFNDKNFTLKAEARIESPTILEGVYGSTTFSSYVLETKVIGKVILEAFALYRDAKWGILNKGPYPPRAETPTQYSVHWRIKNYATDITNVRISTNVLPGTKFTGVYKNNFNLKVNYDQNSGEIWTEIPKILANQGVINEPIEIVFQIENVPSLNQVGEIIPLLSLTNFQAKDDFTGHSVVFPLPEIKSDILSDPTIKISDRRVLPK